MSTRIASQSCPVIPVFPCLAECTVQIPISFMSPVSQIVAAVPAGTTVENARLKVTEAFNGTGPGPQFLFGAETNLSLFFGLTDSDLSTIGEYTVPELQKFTTDDLLVITLFLGGTASTTGQAVLLYDVLAPA